MIDRIAYHSFWQSWGLLISRIVIAGVFAMATIFKFKDMGGTAGYIAAAGIPLSLPLAWIAAIFELLLALSFLSGIFMRHAALLATVYVLFLAFMFHWPTNQMEFSFFVDHFVFAAGLLYMAAFGPGPLAFKK